MIWDYQESAPSDKKFSSNEIDNLYDNLILKFPDLKYVGSLIETYQYEQDQRMNVHPQTEDTTVHARSQTGDMFHPAKSYIKKK